MPRPLWSGTIQISLVSFAVEVYPASNSSRPISFHELDRRTLGRVHHQNIVAGPSPELAPSVAKDAATTHKTSLHLAEKAGSKGEPEPEEEAGDEGNRAIAKSDIVKGYEYEKGKYAIVEPAELKNLRLAGKRTVEISQFAKAEEIDPSLYEKPYFVLPKGGPQATAFAVVRQGMIDSGMVAIGEIVFSGRQHLIAIAPPHDPEQPGMMLYTLRFETELRKASDYAKHEEKVNPDASQLGLAKQLIDLYTRPFDISAFKDHYEEALRELVEAKIQHQPVPSAEPKKKPGKVIDLMEALRKSLAQKAAASGGNITVSNNSTMAETSSAHHDHAAKGKHAASSTKSAAAKRKKSA